MDMPTTFAEARRHLMNVVEGRVDAYHNLIMSSTEYGPERFTALAVAEAAQIQSACEITRLMAYLESLKAKDAGAEATIVYIVDGAGDPVAFESEIHAKAFAETFDIDTPVMVTPAQVITAAEAKDVINSRLEAR